MVAIRRNRSAENPEPEQSRQSLRKTVTRRGFLLGSGVLASAGALAACADEADDNGAVAGDGGPLQADNPNKNASQIGQETVAFDDVHQAGIYTKAPGFLNMVAFDFRAGVGREEVKNLLRLWTEDARRLTQGQNPLGSLEPEMTTKPANLTITCGFGSRFFDVVGKADQKPEWIDAMPKFDKDKLDPQWGQSDLVLQICCDDPVTLAFATRHMTRAGQQYVETKWLQQGFLNAQGVRAQGETPRNLFGQKDGTINPATEKDYDEQVWIKEGDDSPAWMREGTAMVVRRIEMNLDTWEMLDRDSREVTIGRTLDEGEPLSGGHEFDDPDFEARDEFGLPKVDPNSHVALSFPENNDTSQRMLRRAFNYNDAPVPGSGKLTNAGLVWCAFQKDPRTAFITVQQRLNDGDRLNEWITHIGSAMFAVPPGTATDGSRDAYWGASLLES